MRLFDKQKERRKHSTGTSSTGAGTSLRCISVSHLRGCVFAVMAEMIGLSQPSVQGYLTDWDAQKAIWDGLFYAKDGLNVRWGRKGELFH